MKLSGNNTSYKYNLNDCIKVDKAEKSKLLFYYSKL